MDPPVSASVSAGGTGHTLLFVWLLVVQMHCPHAYIMSILFTGPSPQPLIAVILLYIFYIYSLCVREYLLACMSLYVQCVYRYLRRPRILNSLELKLQGVVILLIWVLKTEPSPVPVQ